MNRIARKVKAFFFLFQLAIRCRAFFTFIDFLIYRSIFGYAWSRCRGYDFHKSTIVWINEGNGVHTRLVFLLPRLLYEFTDIKSVDMEYELYTLDGQLVKRWISNNISVYQEIVLDSKEEPNIPKPFQGSLLVKQTLNIEEKRFFIWAKGLYSVASTFIEYYKEGSFVTVTHDYSAFLPDQGIHYKPVGLIPAYCDDLYETHFIIHAAKGGIGTRDIDVTLFNKKGESMTAKLPSIKPFAMRRIFISDLFPHARSFLKKGVGQLELRGLFRYLFARVGYGVVHRKTGAFSFDHCFYSVFSHGFMKQEERKPMSKGFFTPFFILESDQVSTSFFIFHHIQYPYKKNIDLILYDENGRMIISLPAYKYIQGNETEKIEIGPLLDKYGISRPFVGHGEILYHHSSGEISYPKYLDITAEYRSGENFAHVLFGSMLWNTKDEIELNKEVLQGFGCRVICNDAQTTYVAISNCSHHYDYKLDVVFDLILIVNGKAVESRKMSIKPEGTLFRSLEEFFPNACEKLRASGGIGLLSYTVLNSYQLASSFLTMDRKSKSFSIEHTLEMPNVTQLTAT